RSNQLFAAIRTAGDKASVELRAAYAEVIKNIPARTRANKLTILAERQTDKRQTHVHVRGDFLRPGDRVKSGTPKVLPSLKARGEPDRLDLANWIVRPENPLTSRVMVNQIWSHLFGRGLVSTLDDFGTHGAKPSHPELLDWLAVELQKRGWSRKELIRLIVTSATYRQSSHYRQEVTDIDPENVLLARQSRFRLPAEDIRDSQLAAGGLLDYRIGGPSFRPPIPNDMAAVSFGFDGPKQRWEPDSPADQHRRSLYMLFQRTAPNPFLVTFDAPDSLVCCPRRQRSNSPLQALSTLNEAVSYEAACGLARSLSVGCGSISDKIKKAFSYCLGREPTPDELDCLQRFCQQQRKLLETNDAEACVIAGPCTHGDLQENAVLTLLARVVLNLEEFIVRE
ncbi:MAG TPA: DUF1553 domain-containing protein, partial [Verrucomicrobiae bacterium]|nr:DUF1553 domain-containing protein [Verrucomicrobiae bacterium]